MRHAQGTPLLPPFHFSNSDLGMGLMGTQAKEKPIELKDVKVRRAEIVAQGQRWVPPPPWLACVPVVVLHISPLCYCQLSSALLVQNLTGPNVQSMRGNR